MIKNISIGIVIAIVSFAFADYLVGFPFEEPIIYYSLETTDGALVSTYEDVETGERGTVWFYGYTFTYEVNGKSFIRTIHCEGRLKDEFCDISDPIPVTIVYSSIFPSFAQIDDDGAVAFGDYVVRGTLATLFAYGIAIWITILYFKSLKQGSPTTASTATNESADGGSI